MGDGYGKIERWLAGFLHRFPVVKKKTKRSYQRINAYLHKKPYSFKSDHPLHTLPIEHENFFGYYDKSPLSVDGNYILFHEAFKNTSSLPAKRHKIDVGIFDIEKNEVLFRFPTFSYNWQQGARLQWITEKECIFNVYNPDVNGYQAVILDINSAQKRVINWPVYDCFKDQYALTLNFNRLMGLRPDYGYRNNASMTPDELKNTDEDGIWYINLVSNLRRLSISLSTLKQFSPRPGMDTALHKVNHIMIAPDGEHYIFLHRYFIKNRRYDRLFVADKNGGSLKLLADDDMVSHCQWLDAKQIVGYLRDKKEGDRYYKIDVSSGRKSIIGKDKIDQYGDGHPTLSGEKMAFDTYPDKARMKHLYLFNLRTEQLEQLGEFYESLSFYGETRCDLHPRFSYDGSKVFFDSVHEGIRKLYWINLK